MKYILFTIIIIFLASFVSAQNHDISGGIVFESEPYMVLDPANPQHIVIAWMGNVFGSHLCIKAKTSFNGGITWTAATVIPHLHSSYTSADVSIAYDHHDDLFMTYIDHRQSPDSGGVYIVMSSDGGLSWGTPSEVIDNLADGSKEPLDRPWLVIGRTAGSTPDTLYVTTKPAPWIAPPNRPYFKMSYDSGITWNSWRYVDSTGFLVGNVIAAPMAAPAVDSSGRFHCIYPTYVPAASVYPRYILASHAHTNSFTYNVAATIIGAGAMDTLAKAGHRLICDPTNNSHFALFTIENLYGDLDLFYSESFDAGVIWSTQQRVNDDSIGNGKMQDLVWGNFDEHGNIIAGWRDRRNAPGTGYAQAAEIWGSVKWKDSLHFSSNFRISDTSAPYDSIYLAGNGNDFMNIAMAQDTMTAVWGDVRTGALNVWFERRAILTGTVTAIKKIVEEKIPVAKIYPNPASNDFILEGENIIEITLDDITGKQALQQKINIDKTIIHIDRLPPGIYIANIATEYGTVAEKIEKK